MPDKFYRTVVVILLAAILGVQAYSRFVPPTPSTQCTAALDYAAKLVKAADSDASELTDSYDTIAYTKAANINQQIFAANEHTFAAVQITVRLQSALLDVTTNCR